MSRARGSLLTTAVTISIQLEQGGSVKGLPARNVVGNQRTPHHSHPCAPFAQANIGLVHYETIVGEAKQEQFDDFIRALFDRDFGQPMVPHHNTGVLHRF